MTSTFPAPTFTGSRLQAAIIDLDGTMIGTADDFTAGLNGMLAQLRRGGDLARGSGRLCRQGL